MLLPQYHDLSRFPPVRGFSRTSRRRGLSFLSPPGFASPLGYPWCPYARRRLRPPSRAGEAEPLTFPRVRPRSRSQLEKEPGAVTKDSLKALALHGSWNYSTRAGSQSFATALMGFCPFKFYKPVAFLMRAVLFRVLNGHFIFKRKLA